MPKMLKNKKKQKKQIVSNGIFDEFWISNIYFLEKRSMIFQKYLTKSLIHKIKKNIKISRIFWQVHIHEIEKKMLKIIKK